MAKYDGFSLMSQKIAESVGEKTCLQLLSFRDVLLTF